MSAAAAAVKGAADSGFRAQASTADGSMGKSSKSFAGDVATAAANPAGNSNTKKEPQ
jgi:hypothetical protein